MSRVTLCPTGAGRGGVSPGSRRRGSGQELPRRLDMLLRPASGRVALLRLPGMVVLAGTGSAAPLGAAPPGRHQGSCGTWTATGRTRWSCAARWPCAPRSGGSWSLLSGSCPGTRARSDPRSSALPAGATGGRASQAAVLPRSLGPGVFCVVGARHARGGLPRPHGAWACHVKGVAGCPVSWSLFSSRKTRQTPEVSRYHAVRGLGSLSSGRQRVCSVSSL